MCVTESLCCTPETNTGLQLYFNNTKITQQYNNTTIYKKPQTLTILLAPPPAPPQSLLTTFPELFEAQPITTLEAALLLSP